MSIQNKIFDIINFEFNITEKKINENQSLKWCEELGIGFINPQGNSVEIYDENYWNNYQSMIDSDIGKNLTQCRIDICDKFNINPLEILDIGIGNGDFINKFGCRGFDVNPSGIDYLKKNKKFVDIYAENYLWKAISMFDVIEHIVDVKPLLDKTDMLVLSTPIYKDLDDCVASRHLKPDEHFWYFTVHGLIYYMNYFGFDCKYYSTIESKLGRHSIGSFVFKRD